MKPHKNILKLSSLLGITFFALHLTGCTGMMHQFGFERIQDTRPYASSCANASVLVTNLTESVSNQRYQTEDGHICTGLNNENTTETQEQEEQQTDS